MKKLFIPVVFLLVLFLIGCKKKNDEEITKAEPDPSAELNTYLGQMSSVDNPSPIQTPVIVGEPTSSWSGTTFCKSTKYKLGPEYSEGFLLNPTSDVIYPGAIIDGNSIKDGGYRLISLPRTGGVQRIM